MQMDGYSFGCHSQIIGSSVWLNSRGGPRGLRNLIHPVPYNSHTKLTIKGSEIIYIMILFIDILLLLT